MKRRRYLTRDEVTAQLSADNDLGIENQVAPVLDGLAALGVDVDQLVKMECDEPGPTVHGAG